MSTVSPALSEFCGLCRARLPEAHQHLLEAATRKIECACDACAILFSGEHQKYKRIPRGVRYLPDFRLTDEQWDGLGIPVGVAFFVKVDMNKVVALYPSPAGAVESLLTFTAWREIVDENPSIRTMEPEVQGLLAYRIGPARDYFVLPIDECFRLIGIVRLKWKGLSGGAAVWIETARFLDELKRRSSSRK
jgi:hypothetical protein